MYVGTVVLRESEHIPMIYPTVIDRIVKFHRANSSADVLGRLLAIARQTKIGITITPTKIVPPTNPISAYVCTNEL